nr:CARDB domain-containing protein [Hymenobacter gummosus]
MSVPSTRLLARTLVVCLLAWLGLAAQVQAQPDLVVTTPITCPSTVYAGANYQLSATIRTLGTAAQFAFIGAYLSADNTWDGTDVYLNSVGTNLFGSTTSATLNINVTIPATTRAGSYYMVFVADPLDMERESNEQNNVLTTPVSVVVGGPAQLPDLTLWRPSTSFNSLPAGGSLGAFTFVNNQGAGGSPNAEMGYYLSVDTLLTPGDVVLGTSGVGSLSGGGSGTITSAPVLTVPGSTQPGRYYVLVVADHLNRIAESNENNNSRALAITITGGITAARAATPLQALQLYPNPVEGGQELLIGASGLRAASVVATLHNALGQEVARPVLRFGADGTARLSVAGLVPGRYLLQTLVNGQRLHQQLLVK